MAKDAVIALTPEMEREAFSSEFPGVVPAGAVPLDDNGRAMGSPQVRDNISESHLKYLVRVQGMEYRLRMQGVPPATILNLNPYQLKVNSTLMGDIVVPACKQGEPYSITVIRDHRVSREEGVEGDANPIPWVPIILAREFAETYHNNGGVVIYQGNGMVEAPEDTMKKDPALKRNFEDCKLRQIVWMREKFREANNEFNTPNRSGARNINEIHRACAALLHDRGLIAEMPAWMDKIPGQHGLGTQCPQCKSIPQSGAEICPNCAFVLDPQAAFERGTIPVEDISLTRLDRKVLVKMGISELIDETVSERNDRLRKKAAELRKDKAKADAERR